MIIRMTQAASDELDFITTMGVARGLDCSEGSVRAMARRGELPFVQIGQVRAFLRQGVERLRLERATERRATSR